MWRGGTSKIISMKHETNESRQVKFVYAPNFCSPGRGDLPSAFFLLQPLLPWPILVPFPISSLYASLTLPPTVPPPRTIPGFSSLLSLVLV